MRSGYGDTQVLVIGASVMDMKVAPRTALVEPARSNPGQIRLEWGGVARNIAENLARLGVKVRLVTAVGDDFWGRGLLQHLKSLGIDTTDSIISTEHATAAFVGLHHQDYSPWLAFDDMAVMRSLTPGHLNRLRGLIRQADMVCVDANLSARAFKTLFRLTARYATPVCVDPTAALLAHRVHPYLPEIAVITPDKDEAEALVGFELRDDEAVTQAARRLVQLGVRLAIINLGAQGLFYATPEENGRLPVLTIDQADPIGAGDALTAAVAYGLLEGVSPEEAVRLGMAAATLTLLCHETVCPTLSVESLYEKLMM
ncbi:MAG: carbohydrate kinase family protein [Anaerolineae bacterium]|nr:carbohydrate kinase family protein [Anaerolineae bacterium]